MSSPIPEIDAEKLEHFIKWFREHWVGRNIIGFPPDTADGLKMIADAAEATLAILPRWKEIEVEQFAVIGWDGRCHGCWRDERDAAIHARRFGHTIVRLTGKAKVRA